MELFLNEARLGALSEKDIMTNRYKFFIVLISILILQTASVSAQTLALTVKGGPASNWLLNKNLKDDLQFSIGQTVGAGGIFYIIPDNYYSDKMYGICVDVLYTGHNQKYKGKVLVGDETHAYESTVNLSYVDIPFLFRYAQDMGGTFLEVGGQYSTLLSAKQSYSDNSEVGASGSTNIKESLENYDLSAVLGFGLDFPVTKGLFITSGVKCIYGLIDITQKSQGFAGYQPTTRAAVGVNLALTYRMNYYHSNGRDPKAR